MSKSVSAQKSSCATLPQFPHHSATSTMASQESHLDTIEFIQTPPAKPQPPASTATGVRTTDVSMPT